MTAEESSAVQLVLYNALRRLGENPNNVGVGVLDLEKSAVFLAVEEKLKELRQVTLGTESPR
jgi:hypothetical protein